MSFFASVLRTAYRLSGAKKAFGLPEDKIRKVIDKQNRNHGVFTPTDHKAHYEMVTVNGFPCLIVREHPMPSERAILYFFGGGMVIGPDSFLHSVGAFQIFRNFPCNLSNAVLENDGVIVIPVVVNAVFNDIAENIGLPLVWSPAVSDVGCDIDDLKRGKEAILNALF